MTPLPIKLLEILH